MFLCCCTPNVESSSPVIVQVKDSLQFKPRYELCYGVVRALLDIDYTPKKTYYLRDETNHPGELADAKVVFPPGEKTSVVTIDGRKHVLRIDSCLDARYGRYAGLIHSSMAWDDLMAFEELNGGWERELKRTIHRATLSIDTSFRRYGYVPKPGEIIVSSVVETYWSGENLSSKVLYLGHNKNEIDTIVQAVEASPLLLKMMGTTKKFSISYPVKYYNNHQLESFAEFERRLEREKKEKADS